MDKRLVLFIIFLFSVLLIRLLLFYSSRPEYKDGEHLTFDSRIVSDPKIYENYQSFSVLLPSSETLFIRTDIYPEYSYQDKINVSGNLKYQLLNKKSQILTMDRPLISFVKNSENDFLASLYSIRQKIINVFENNLPKEEGGLLMGIVFGIKIDMSKESLDQFKKVGVMHVVAASGMNVTLAAGFIFYSLGALLKRQKAIILSIIAIVFYDFLAGFQPSIIRASIMGIIAFSAQALGKQAYSFYALILAAFTMLFIWPYYLTDVGFQLSFASTIGILVIPQFFKKIKNFVFEDFLTTFSAQIATLPILLGTFGTYSLWSVVVNILVLWTIPFLMIVGALGAAIAFISEPLSRIFLFISLPFLLYFQTIVDIFANMGGNIKIDNFPWQISVSYYLFLLAVLLFAIKRRSE